MTHITQKITSITIIATLLLTLSGFSVAHAEQSAEYDSTTQVPSAQAIGNIPAEYNTMFSVEWGGGSLYQLKANLATQGCIVNNIVVTENGLTHSYNLPQTCLLYTSPSPRD